MRINQQPYCCYLSLLLYRIDRCIHAIVYVFIFRRCTFQALAQKQQLIVSLSVLKYIIKHNK